MTIAFAFLAFVWLFTAVTAGVYGISSHLLARHIRAHHPILWKTLREPDLATAQGNRRDPLGAWLNKGKYRKMHDPYMLRWCPHVQQLSLYAFNAFLGAIVLTLAGIIVSKFLLK